MTKRKNVQDVTLKNLRVLKAAVAKLNVRVSRLTGHILRIDKAK